MSVVNDFMFQWLSECLPVSCFQNVPEYQNTNYIGGIVL